MKFHIPILSTLEEAAQAGLSEGMEAMLERSNELAPELSGEMIDGGAVRIDDLTGQVSYKAIGYPYVVDQHENLELQHPNGGQAKFLETAADEVAVEKFIAARVRGVLDG